MNRRNLLFVDAGGYDLGADQEFDDASKVAVQEATDRVRSAEAAAMTQRRLAATGELAMVGGVRGPVALRKIPAKAPIALGGADDFFFSEGASRRRCSRLAQKRTLSALDDVPAERLADCVHSLMAASKGETLGRAQTGLHAAWSSYLQAGFSLLVDAHQPAPLLGDGVEDGLDGFRVENRHPAALDLPLCKVESTDHSVLSLLWGANTEAVPGATQASGTSGPPLLF